MFRKLLNVGKGHSNADKLIQQQQQQNQKNLFQLNEIKSYGFSHHCCLGYSQSLSLLAVGSKTGLLRVFGQPTVEFSYQLEPATSIRQIEFIDCRELPSSNNDPNRRKDNKKKDEQQQQHQQQSLSNSPTAKLIVLTDIGQLHLFELKTVKTLNFTDNTTQTDVSNNLNNCCQESNNSNEKKLNSNSHNNNEQDSDLNPYKTPVYTRLDYTGQLNYFIFKLDDDDRSKRVTTFEISANGQVVYVGTEGGNLYQIPIDKFELISESSSVGKTSDHHSSVKRETGIRPIIEDTEIANNSASKLEQLESDGDKIKDSDVEEVNVNDEPIIEQNDEIEPFEMVEFEAHVSDQLGDEVKPKKQGAIESVKRHPASASKLLLSYHRGLSIIYNVENKQVEKYFYHKEVLESSCFASTNNGDFFYTSHNDGSYIKWDTRKGSQAKADEDALGQLYGPYPCKPTPKIQACTGLVNDQPEELIIFSGGMPRATYDDRNPVTIVRRDSDGKDTIKIVLDFTSKVLDFAVITRPRGQLGVGAKSTSGGGSGGGGGKKNKNKQQQQQQQQRNQPIAVALAILADEEFVVIDLLNSESYLEFPLPYLNCVQPSAITCNQHYSDISNELYQQLLSFNKRHSNGKFSQNEWPITGGKVINAPDVKSHDILLTGHEDGSVNLWDVSDLVMRHLLHVPTAKFFSTEDDDLVPIDGPTVDDNENNDNSASTNQQQDQNNGNSWPPLKRVGRFDPYSDDTRLAIRKISLCPQKGTLLVAGTGGQVLVFELRNESSELEALVADEVTIVSDHRFTWKGREKLTPRSGAHKLDAGYQLSAYVQLNPPASATSTDLRSDWHLFAVGTSYGFIMYDYASKHTVVNKCTLNVQDFAIVSGDSGAGAMSRKKSFRKSLRESFRRLRRGRSQRQQQQQQTQSTTGAVPVESGGPAVAGSKPAFSRGATTGIRTLNSAPVSGSSLADTAAQAAAAHRQLCSGERQVEFKNELSSIVKCITLTSAIITSNLSLFKPSLWVGTNSGTVLLYAIDLASEQEPTVKTEATSSEATTTASASDEPTSTSDNSPIVSTTVQPKTVARLIKEIQLKHKAPIIAIFTSPEAPQIALIEPDQHSSDSAKSTPEKRASELFSSPTSSPVADKSNSEQHKSQSADQSESNNELTDSQKQQQQRSQSPQADRSPSSKSSGKQDNQQQPRVLICSEEQFKVFNLPNLKPFCKFKLTANEGLRAKKISITQFLKPSAMSGSATVVKLPSSSSTTLNTSKSLQSFATQTSPPASPVPPADDASEQQANGAQNTNSGKHQQQEESNNNSLSALNNNSTSTTQTNAKQDKELLNAKFGVKTNATNPAPATLTEKSLIEHEHLIAEASLEPYMVCMSNQGDCAIYSVPDLKRQAQIQVCKRDDVNGIMSAMLTNYGEGYYLRSSSNFLRFSISTQRVLRVLSVV